MASRRAYRRAPCSTAAGWAPKRGSRAATAILPKTPNLCALRHTVFCRWGKTGSLRHRLSPSIAKTSPVQLCTGILAGLLLHQQLKVTKLPFKTLWLTIPGTVISSLITVCLFGGITSAGSSIIVQFLYGLGLNQLASVLLVQLITDYGDRLLSVIIVTAVIAALPKRSFITK